MNYSMRVLVYSVACLAIISGCGEDNKNAADNIVNEPDLNGRYVGPCSGSDIADLSMSTSYRFNTDGTFARYQDFYTSEDCSDEEAVGTTETSGNYSVDNDGAPNSAGGAIRFDLENAFVEVRTEGMADALNAAEFCGRDDYSVGNKVDISSSTDQFLCPVRQVPDTLYGVYREDGGNFYLNDGGLDEMSQSDDDRPNKLDTETVFAKQ